MYEKFKGKIFELLKKGIITKTVSKISSPIFIAKKSNNDVRIIVHYRKVNKFITDDNYFFPAIYDNLHLLSEMKFFSKIDLTSSFYQIPIAEECQEITSFTCPLGQYKFKTLPFGLKSSPKLFQRTISDALQGLTNIIIFVDDILLYDKTRLEHEKNILRVLEQLQKCNFEINFAKSTFFKLQIKYLGMDIDGEGYRANLDSLKKTIENIRPRNIKDCQKINGYLSFFRAFVPKISELLIPITDKIKKKEVDISNIVKAKNQVMEEIRKNIKIVYPRPNEKFTLQTDSSNRSCSGFLARSHGIVGIFSHKFTDTEFKYTIVEKEFLGILLSLRKFRHITIDSPIDVFTDSKNLLYDTAVRNSRLQRWKILLSEYKSLHHINGTEQIIE